MITPMVKSYPPSDTNTKSTNQPSHRNMTNVAPKTKARRIYTKPIRPLSPISIVDDGTIERAKDGRLWIATTIRTRNGHSRRIWILQGDSRQTTPKPSIIYSVWNVVQDTTVWIGGKANRFQEAAAPHLSDISDKMAFYGYTSVKNIYQWYSILGKPPHEEFEMLEHTTNQ